ncbi:hypothetical protein [Paraburkholderia sp. DHOC27]|uniref:hypothetical protein n=1 Tax=Paraburkholderia sp. DHOC27 TaxID=2303330 RepID=UPI000E3C64B7|nr:hypothetical protein [Paraburkholderia sp. DHOC27]RFU49387.1 hypothetical protein D0B32_06215 [Paraburkholderia sp. DHOC27]
MESKSPLPQHLGRDISQIGLALRDCARQLRYAARNVPGPVKNDRPIATRATSSAAAPLKPPSYLSLESVAHLADDLIETAESFASHAVPTLQDHWKSPVPLEPLTTYLELSTGSAKAQRKFSMTFYAAAKRMIMQSGATDVLIFEHRISATLERMSVALTGPELATETGKPAEKMLTAAIASRSALCLACAQLVLSLLEMQPIRSTRFDSLPDANAPWWLVTEPNEYVFLMLALTSLAKDTCPSGVPGEPDAAVRFFSDVVGARESAFRQALKGPEPLQALSREIEYVITHLC